MITDVGIDMDGVMYDFASDFRLYCSKRMGRSDLKPPVHWEFYEDWDLDEHTFYLWMDEACKDGLFLNGEPMQNVIEGWKRLRGLGLRIHILTHRRFSAYENTVKWLSQHNLVPDSLHFGQDKTIIKEIAPNKCATIDDHIVYYEDYHSNGVLSFLCTREWNKGVSARRVSDLLDFAFKVEHHNEYCRMMMETPQ